MLVQEEVNPALYGMALDEFNRERSRQRIQELKVRFGRFVSSYNDDEALEDGMLVQVSMIARFADFGIHRVTRSVWSDWTTKDDMDTLLRIARMLKASPKTSSGWHIGEVRGRTFWLVPNELGSLTLMYPEDY